MKKVILWRRADGGLSFTVCETDDEQKALSHKDKLLTHPGYSPMHQGLTFIGICNDTDMPDGGCITTNPVAAEFKNAWDIVDGRVAVNMPKAREIHRQSLRGMRTSKLAALDIDYLRALETGADLSAIVERKRALRDVTAYPAIDAATTPEELKASVPEVLK